MQLLGDVEAALAALKESAVSDRHTATVEVMELMMAASVAVTNAKIAEVWAEPDEARTVNIYNIRLQPVCCI